MKHQNVASFHTFLVETLTRAPPRTFPLSFSAAISASSKEENSINLSRTSIQFPRCYPLKEEPFAAVFPLDIAVRDMLS